MAVPKFTEAQTDGSIGMSKTQLTWAMWCSTIYRIAKDHETPVP